MALQKPKTDGLTDGGGGPPPPPPPPGVASAAQNQIFQPLVMKESLHDLRDG